MLHMTLESLQKLEGLTGSEDSAAGNSSQNAGSQYDSFVTLVVLEFSPNAPPPTIQWILDKITLSKLKGGSELLVCPIMNERHEIIKAHVSATLERLFIAAERMELKKMYRDDTMRELCVDDIDNYKDSDDLQKFLTMAERQRIILHELQSIRARSSDFYVASLPKVRLYQGEPIIPRCLNEGIITDCIALHDRQDLAELSSIWYKAFFHFQPLDKVNQYFGQKIAMYFAFLGYYTYFLLLPAIFGIISQYLLSDANQEIAVLCFFVFNLVWATLFFESWKRRQSELAFQWGTIDTESFEEPRVQFRGIIMKDPVTGRLQPYYSTTRRLLKFYLVSLPVMIFAFALSFYVMLVYFYLDENIKAYVKGGTTLYDTCLLLIPTIFYSVVLLIMNAVYRPVAVALNDWENHRLESEYESNLVVKLALFNFANNFLCMFYVAFYLQDMKLLRNTLGTLLITMQIVQQLTESLLPYLLYKMRKVSITMGYTNINSSSSGGGCISQQALILGEVEKAKVSYDSTIDDYLEMFIQFGYVYFFSAVYPTAALWAFLNNLTEIRTDAFKLCRTFRRPFSQPAENIGVWTVAFELMGIIAVMTNCGLIALSPKVKNYTANYNQIYVVLGFVAAEHVILAVKAGLANLIPDRPEWVQTQVEAMAYQSKQAWRRQRCREPLPRTTDSTASSLPATDNASVD